MSFRDQLDYASKEALLKQAAAEDRMREMQYGISQMSDPITQKRAGEINLRAPWMPAEAQLALAKSYASDDAVDALADMYARSIVQEKYNPVATKRSGYVVSPDALTMRAEANNNKESFAEQLWIYDALKATSRTAVALSVSGTTELMANIGSGIGFRGGARSNREVKSGSVLDELKLFGNSLSIVQLFQNWEDQGDGFFMASDLMEKQKEAARAYRGTVGGATFTVGRAAASVVRLEEGSKWYNGVSGFIDAVLALAVPEPTSKIVKLGKTAGQYSRAAVVSGRTGKPLEDVLGNIKGEVPLVAEGSVGALTGDLSKLNRGTAGLTEALEGASLDVKRFFDFMDTNPIATRLVDDLSKETSVYKILKLFNWKLTPDEAIAMAAANTPEQVKMRLLGSYTIGERTLSTSIKDIVPGMSTPVKYLLKRSPLAHSKLLSRLPDRRIILNGDDKDTADAVKNMALFLKTAGLSEEEISGFVATTVTRLSKSAASDDIRDAYKSFEDLVRISLKRNNVRDEAIDSLLDSTRYDMDKLKNYLADMEGRISDNGFMAGFAKILRDHLPEESVREMLEFTASFGPNAQFGFVRPMVLSELFQRAQILPDYREIRRLTSNKMIADSLNIFGEKTGLMLKKPTAYLTSKSRRMDVKIIREKDRYNELRDQYDQLNNRNLTPDETTRLNEIAEEMDDLTEIAQRRILTGEANMPLAFMNVLQQRIWKPLALSTFGYVIRNALDAQLRMAVGAQNGLLSHPGEYIALVLGETKETGRIGRLLTRIGATTSRRGVSGQRLVASDDWGALRREEQELLGMSLREQGLGQHSTLQGTHRSNMWRPVSRADDPRTFNKHTDGIIQQGRLANSDPVQRKVAENMAIGMPEDIIIEEAIDEIMRGNGFRELAAIYKRGAPIVNARTGEIFYYPPIDLTSVEPHVRKAILENHVRTVFMGNVGMHTGNYQDVAFMYAFDRVPYWDKRVTRSIEAGETGKIGAEVNVTPDGDKGIVIGVNGAELTIVPVHTTTVRGVKVGESVFNKTGGTKAARRMIKRKEIKDPNTNSPYGLPPQVVREIGFRERTGLRGSQTLAEGMDAFTNAVFVELYAKKWVKTLERSPTYRRFYYAEIAKRIDSLSPDDAKIAVANLKRDATRQGYKDIGEYLGNPKMAAKLEEVAKRTDTGNYLKVEELDDYARMVGIEKTRELLYDATDRNNLEDILRIIAPFVTAWREIIGKWMSLMIEDPSVASRFGRYAQGLMTSDPDSDGRGFWYRDEQTGDMMFKFPVIFGLPAAMSLTEKVFGGDSESGAFFEAPIKQMSQGIGVLPGIGPLAQLPASWLLRNQPDTSAIVQTLLPYGRTDFSGTGGVVGAAVTGLTPTALKNVQDIFLNDEKNMATRFAQTYVDVARAKSTSGKYDLSTEEGLEQLKRDSKATARVISIFRSIQQFFGPTSPRVSYQVDLKNQKDVYVSTMIDELEKFQLENYDTAIQRFISLYGDEAVLYVGSKTQSQVSGLEATPEFGDWEVANRDIMTRYKRVGAYFAPKGSEFNFDVWKRQELEGSRRKLNLDELTQIAQNRVASAKYRAARKQFGVYPNEQQRSILSQYRAYLHKQYPGFPRMPEFTVNETANDIAELNDASRDERLRDNPVTSPLRMYLDARERAYAELGASDTSASPLAGKRGLQARAQLLAYGEQLADKNPEFDRVWQRVLIQEVED